MLETTAECFRLVLLIEWTSNSIQYFCCHNNAKFDLKPVVIYMHLKALSATIFFPLEQHHNSHTSLAK